LPSLNLLAEGWAQFFHASAPATPVAVFRIALGSILLVNAAVLSQDLAFLYGPNGAVGAANRDQSFRRLRVSIFAVVPATLPWLQACLAVHGVAALLLTIGLATQVSTAVAFVTLSSLQSRNPVVTYGGDDVLRVMSLLLIFAPAGETLSADAWMAHGSWHVATNTSVWCWRLMQLQVATIYLKAFVAKLTGESWRNGSAVFLATEVTDFRRRRLPEWARRPPVARLATWTTLAIEGALGTVIFMPAVRGPIAIIGIAMHLTMEWFLNVFLFGAAMIACLLLFLTYS
jgi:hypothetical protein